MYNVDCNKTARSRDAICIYSFTETLLDGVTDRATSRDGVPSKKIVLMRVSKVTTRRLRCVLNLNMA